MDDIRAGCRVDMPKVLAAAAWPLTALFIIFAGADGELAAIAP